MNIRFKRIALAFVTMTLNGCLAEETYDESNDVDASHVKEFVGCIEEVDYGSKTSLTIENRVIWERGDLLAVFRGNEIPDKYRVTDESAGTDKGIFVLEECGAETPESVSTNIALYPYDTALTCPYAAYEMSSYEICNVSIPAVQQYKENSFPEGTFVMAASTESGHDCNFSFHNLWGALKLQLKGTCRVKSVTVTGNKEEILSGTAKITIYKGSSYVPYSTIVGDRSTSVVLECGTEGVQLDSEVPTSFIVTLPPVLFSEGFTVVVTDTDGKEMTLRTIKSNEIKRSAILRMPAMTVPLVYDSENIVFEDDVVKELCVQAFDTNGDGEISYTEAEAVTDLGRLDASRNAYITTFNELQYFTSLKEIPNECFKSCGSLTEITIPEGVVSIGEHAFYNCYTLASVKLPESLMTIGQWAFMRCYSLSDVEIPDNVAVIDRAFMACSSLESICLPESIVSMDGAFESCEKLIEVNIPSKVTSFESTFWGCVSLTEIVIPDNIVEIGQFAFRLCSNLSDISLPAGLTSIGSMAFSECSFLKEIRLPESLESLGQKAFFQSGLRKVTIPGSISVVTAMAFEECRSLSEVVIPESVETIGEKAFYMCESLTSVKIPESVNNIESGAFRGCIQLSDINIPERVTVLNDFLFAGCVSLVDITIPESVVHIKDYVFSECIAMEKIVIPKSVTSLGSGVFEGCLRLSDVTLPEGMAKIGGWAFADCTSLAGIDIPESVAYWGDNVFRDCTALENIVLPKYVDLSSAADGNMWFYGCTSLKSVTLPEFIRRVPESAFAGCGSLKEITIPESVETIELGAFQDCTSLEIVNLKSPVCPKLWMYAFSDCPLKNIYVPYDSVDAYKTAEVWSDFQDIISGVAI